MANEKKKWFLRSMFIRLTRKGSKEEIAEKNEAMEVKLTPSEIASIEYAFGFKITSDQISEINKMLKSARQNKYAKENNIRAKYSKADSVIEALNEVYGVKLGIQREEDIRNSIQQELTKKEKKEIIEKRAKSARFRTGVASLVAVAFIGGASATKSLGDSATNREKESATTAILDVDEYSRLEEVNVNGLTQEGENGSKSFRQSLVVDGTEVDASEIETTEAKEASIESAMSELNSPEDIEDYVSTIVESEYNEANHENVIVSSVKQESEAVSIYVDDEGVARFSTEETDKNQTITSIKTVDENGNTATLKYANVDGEYVRVYAEGEESKGNQALNSDVFDLVQAGFSWSEEYYNENTMYSYDENGNKVVRTDENGEEVHADDLTKEDFRNALDGYKTRKIAEEVQNTYVQENDEDGIEPGD